ncbi:MAG: transposase [Deltaproteobacteria bacterium]|nr:transposase [Deltaproteobacteria bacterium]
MKKSQANSKSLINTLKNPRTLITPKRLKNYKEHGGQTPKARQRRKRPLSVKEPLHLVLRSDYARGARKLTKHQPMIQGILKKAAGRFKISIYEKAINTNHIHLLVRGKTRESLQNFFRVTAGHIAQNILRDFPLQPGEKGQPAGHGSVPVGGQKTAKCPQPRGAPPAVRENKFWETRIYSRIVSWGREFNIITTYIYQNVLESFGVRTKTKDLGGNSS